LHGNSRRKARWYGAIFQAAQSATSVTLENDVPTAILNFRIYADPIFDPARDDPQRFERIVERALEHSVDLH